MCKSRRLHRASSQHKVSIVSELNIDHALLRAHQRFGSARKARSDRGAARIDARAEAKLQQLLRTQERPSFSEVARQLRLFCRAQRVPAPSRASIYNAVERAPMPFYAASTLPDALRQALYNLAPESDMIVPGDQLVFHAFNYGTLAAISFASALPWLCLARASRRRGWRPKSKSLLESVKLYREI